MLKTILAFFGYVKVPKEAIQMSILIESHFKLLSEIIGHTEPELAERLKNLHKVAETLTDFLRSGRLLQ